MKTNKRMTVMSVDVAVNKTSPLTMFKNASIVRIE